MIFNNSRYYDGELIQDSENILVFREFPKTQTLRMFGHVWVDGERADSVAEKFLGSSQYWHEIFDLNPNILDPWSIKPGAIVRVEYV
jgi:hypothetical protein